MAPTTITEVTYVEELQDNKECLKYRITKNETNNLKDQTKTDKQSNIQQSNISPYDAILKNIKDPKYFAPIRRWEKRMGFVTPILWISSISIILIHIITVVWFTGIFWVGHYPKWQSFVFGYFMGQVAGFGVTGGAHRYWCHRSYKAKWPLQVILLVCYSAAGQNTIFEWVRDHRVHHKFSETSADPHDANRGFFFSHVGWLMMKKHPDVIREGSKFDLSDITNDPLVQFHTRYFLIFKILFCWLLPVLVTGLWDESWDIGILSQALVRYVMSLNFTWCVNSFAHLWGNKPYDKHIMPSENYGVSLVAMGEGWHNYHHTFPWDYKASELGMTNTTTTLLNQFAKIGWAYDMKEASPSLVKEVAKNRGESHEELEELE